MIVLVIEVLLLLWHMDVFIWAESTPQSAYGKPAGIIAKSENRLHRRPMNSLIWEKSNASEAVYFHDSLLTLEQSTATLELDSKMEIKLSENTLVTIEPPDEGHTGEIRLKFNRGGLRTRNPFSATKITTDDFTVDVQSGSDLELRQIENGDYEVQLARGNARITNSTGERAITPSEFVRVQKGQLSTLKLDQNLKWVLPPVSRIYSHKADVAVDLRWAGKAQELIVQTMGIGEKIIALDGEKRQISLDLDFGNHSIYLRSGKGADERLSKPLPIEVWRAPVVHLVMPLPRDRLKINTNQDFFWARLPEASSYIFQAEGLRTKVMQKVLLTAHQSSFTEEDDVQWSVWAKDQEGFLIPPLYKYSLFIRAKPFAPPRLHTPRLHAPQIIRQPAQSPKKRDGAFLWNIIFPSAHAEDDATYEVGLTWDAISGANRYLIEISETSDFRNPIVSKEVSRPEYVVKGLREHTYYWRVAAGHSTGRMGMFSPVATIAVGPTEEFVPPVAPPPAAVPIVASSEKVNLSEPVVQTPVAVAKNEEPKITPSSGVRIYWRGGYGLINVKADDGVNAELSGMKTGAFGFETDLFIRDNQWWTLSGQYSQTAFKPDPEAQYPYQEDISIQQGELSATFMQSQSEWNFGFTALMLPELSRVGAEAIEANSQFAFGPHVQGLWKESTREYRMNLGVAIGAGGYGAFMSHRFVGKPFCKSFLLGIQVDGVYLSDSPNSTITGDASLIFGFEF